ncbi:MAG: glutamate--tRNA ligase family protein, partial [Acidobacteriota bacterium]
FAHVPLILGPDKKRLSKRHGATSVMEYDRLGYLPEAMVNFLSLLGWSPGDDRELMTREELIAAFSLDGISGGNAVFNQDKLDWYNQQYLMRLDLDDLVGRLEPRLREAGLWSAPFEGERRPWLRAVLELIRPRAKRLGQLVDDARPFLQETVELEAAAAAKHLANDEVRRLLGPLADEVERLASYDAAALEQALRGLADAHAIKAATLIHATRVAVTGRAASPGLFEVMALLGRTVTTRRLRTAQEFPSR